MQLLEYFKDLTRHPKNAEELKGLILQLAVQGKLTQKWREANTSEFEPNELKELISKGKQKVLKESGIKKEKPIDEFDSSEVKFELPKSWVWVRFASAAYICRGGSPRPIKSFLTDDPKGINWIKIGDTKGKTKYIESCEEKIISEGLKMSRLVEPGDFILSNSMSFGKPYIMKTTGCIHDGWLLIREVKEAIDQDFLYHMLSSPYVYDSFKESAAGGVVQNLNIDKVRQTLIPIPPLAEQKAIVEVVNQLFVEVEQLEALTKERIQLKEDFATSALNQLTQASEAEVASPWDFLKSQFSTFFTEKENIKKLREAILQLAVQGKLTHHWRTDVRLSGVEVEPASTLLERIKAEKKQLIKEKKIKKEKPLPTISEDEIPYDLPEGWIWCRLTDLTEVGTGSTPSKANSEYYIGGTVPWYTSSATNDEFAVLQDVKITDKALKETNCKIFPSGSLIIAMYGQGKTRGQISELVIPGATNQAIAAMVFFESSKLTKQYLKYYFQKFYHEIRLLAEGGAQPNLNVGKVKATLIPIPPTLEIEAIVKKVNDLMDLCHKLEKEIDTHQTTQEQWMQSCLREVLQPKAKEVVK